jgi:hypothetical protein
LVKGKNGKGLGDKIGRGRRSGMVNGLKEVEWKRG